MKSSRKKEARRPLKTRQYAWSHKLAHFFVAIGMTPNQMSVASIAVATLGAAAFLASTTSPIWLIAAAVCIQLRLLSNMLDGLMAVEEGKKTPTGGIYNELPDRIADILFLTAAGSACNWPELGWLASILAVLTAYIRALGGSLGCDQDFCGPMAKPHRMFTLTVGSVIAAFLPTVPVLPFTLAIIIIGSLITIIRRTHRLARNLSGGDND